MKRSRSSPAPGAVSGLRLRSCWPRAARVVLADIRLEAAQGVADRIIGNGGSAQAQPLDLADEGSIQTLVRATLDRFGRVDILHNNAADLSPELSTQDRDVESMTADNWDSTFRVNVRGTMLACKYVLPHLVAIGGGTVAHVPGFAALSELMNSG